jgi:hypothetical protein
MPMLTFCLAILLGGDLLILAAWIVTRRRY